MRIQYDVRSDLLYIRLDAHPEVVNRLSEDIVLDMRARWDRDSASKHVNLGNLLGGMTGDYI